MILSRFAPMGPEVLLPVMNYEHFLSNDLHKNNQPWKFNNDKVLASDNMYIYSACVGIEVYSIGASNPIELMSNHVVNLSFPLYNPTLESFEKDLKQECGDETFMSLNVLKNLEPYTGADGQFGGRSLDSLSFIDTSTLRYFYEKNNRKIFQEVRDNKDKDEPKTPEGIPIINLPDITIQLIATKGHSGLSPTAIKVKNSGIYSDNDVVRVLNPGNIRSHISNANLVQPEISNELFKNNIYKVCLYAASPITKKQRQLEHAISSIINNVLIDLESRYDLLNENSVLIKKESQERRNEIAKLYFDLRSICLMFMAPTILSTATLKKYTDGQENTEHSEKKCAVFYNAGGCYGRYDSSRIWSYERMMFNTCLEKDEGVSDDSKTENKLVEVGSDDEGSSMKIEKERSLYIIEKEKELNDWIKKTPLCSELLLGVDKENPSKD